MRTTGVHPGSLRFLAGWLARSLLSAWIWTAVVPSHRQARRSADEVHHAVMTAPLAEPAATPKPSLGLLETYPQAAHQIAAWATPLCDRDPFRALRTLGLASVIGLLGVQWSLLCRSSGESAGPDPLVGAAFLLGWQWLAFETKTADLNFVYGNFFFSQALGSLFLWLAIALVADESARPARRMALELAAIGLAALAYACHLVPGLVGFGFLGIAFLARAIEERTVAALAPLFAAGAAGALMVFGTGQLSHMASCRSAEGSLPIRHLPILLCWVPTAVVAGILLIRSVRSRRRLSDLGIVCALLAAGAIQAGVAFQWLVRDDAGTYAVKKLFFYTFPFASFLWMRWGMTFAGAVGRRRSLPPGWGGIRPFAAAAAFAGAFYLNFAEHIDFELHYPRLSSERDPVDLARAIDSRPDAFAGCGYLDHAAPESSLYVNVVGLRRGVRDSYRFLKQTGAVRGRERPSGPVSDVLLPFAENVNYPGELQGPFLRVSFDSFAVAAGQPTGVRR